MAKNVRAGWFLDRDDPNQEKYWDGEAWTGETRQSPSLDDFLGPIEPLLMDLIGVPSDKRKLDLDTVTVKDDAGDQSAESTSRVNRTTATN